MAVRPLPKLLRGSTGLLERHRVKLRCLPSASDHEAYLATADGQTEGPTMKRSLVELLTALGVACATPNAVTRGTRAQLRDRQGLCSKAATPGYGWTGGSQIGTCAHLGTPGMLGDVPTAPLVKTRVNGMANSPTANTGSWQMEVFRDVSRSGSVCSNSTWCRS